MEVCKEITDKVLKKQCAKCYTETFNSGYQLSHSAAKLQTNNCRKANLKVRPA